MKRLSAEEKKEHEAFKKRLVEDVLGQGSEDKVSMEKVVMLCWQFRSDPSVVTFMARFAAKYAGSRHVFDGIEFYLPQLVHMIIHLEVDWDDGDLERFALIIAQRSIHFALQLNWILQGALQDYHPECSTTNEEGDVITATNPKYNPVVYLRCVQLLQNVERCIVYGKPRAYELQRLYEKGNITKSELLILCQADRRFNAMQITAADEINDSSQRLERWMYFTPPVPVQNRKEAAKQTKAVYRFVVLERQVLNVYANRRGVCSSKLKLQNAFSIEKSTVEAIDDFSIRVATTKHQFCLTCQMKEEASLWMRRLKEEATEGNLFPSHLVFFAVHQESRVSNEEEDGNAANKTSTEGEEVSADTYTANRIKLDLTEAQLKRYEFFKAERDFVDYLTEIAESLRFEERAERKKLAPGLMEKLPIPPNVYLPLCNSSDIWRRVTDKLADETRVFNTKARCPTVMHFVSKRGEKTDTGLMHPNVDVAQYMYNQFDLISETETVELNAGPNTDPNVAERTRTSSNVWEEDNEVEHAEEGDEKEGTGTSAVRSPKFGSVRVGGNLKVQKLMRESIVVLPQKLARQLNPHNTLRRNISVMDRQTAMHPEVVILEGELPRSDVSLGTSANDEASVVSVERSSILCKDQILLGTLDDCDIDPESIKRATDMISGGVSWAQKSAKMLERARQKSEELDERCQVEIASCLAKSNDDLRQEVFIMQMIHFYKSVFAQAKLPLWLKTYRILSTSSSTGLIELLTDATSLDALKKTPGYPVEGGLRKYFEITYKGPDSPAFKKAQTNFIQSLAAYSLVSYLLGLKDRHNGNIMIDTRGHLIFIDFGFALGMAPGHEFSFERAPFKLTKEYVEVMGGADSECYKEFGRLFVDGFEECRKNSQIALGLIEIMMFKSNYPCFSGWRYGNGQALTKFESRLMLRVPNAKVKAKAYRLIRRSRQHFGTYLYDKFQNATNGYAM